ncbi:AraC family transcriptional regulator [Pseudomonas cucumis]|uniref:AraC family transcriptional regulator n=1 Tax=Pseudomonas cucumis TaxID=2954082 RepID=A0ABY9ERS7_9PSED|nr:AraC family transcriptional regulator [Pseudomonas cucumis]WLG82422.1 AraC family transcriptional regulator [Pseudomonas cucumis]
MTLVMEHVSNHSFAEFSKMYAAGTHYPKHTHEEYVISANLTGHERIWFDGKSQEVGPNQITLYNPLTIQSSEFCPTGTHFMSIHLDARQVRTVLAENDALGNRDQPIFHEGVITDSALLSAIREFEKAPQPDEQEERLVRLLIEMTRFQSKPDISIMPAKLSRLIEYMRENLQENISLEHLCREANISKFHLVRAFKKTTNLPPMQYFKQLKLIEGRRRLRKGETPLKIAMDLGFYDQGHFCNAFRKVMGVSPVRYTSML